MSNIEGLNGELKKLSEICMKLKPWVERGLLDYRVLESEHSQQLARNQQLKEENLKAEELIQEKIKSAELIELQAKKKDAQSSAERHSLWVTAQSKFREVEKRIDEADRKIIKGMIKELEMV